MQMIDEKNDLNNDFYWIYKRNQLKPQKSFVMEKRKIEERPNPTTNE